MKIAALVDDSFFSSKISASAKQLGSLPELLSCGGLRYGLHELAGWLGNRQIALFHKFSNVHLPAVKVLIRVLIGAQDRALQRNAGKGTAGSRINKNLRPHGGSRIGGCIPAFRPGSSGSVNP